MTRSAFAGKASARMHPTTTRTAVTRPLIRTVCSSDIGPSQRKERREFVPPPVGTYFCVVIAVLCDPNCAVTEVLATFALAVCTVVAALLLPTCTVACRFAP